MLQYDRIDISEGIDVDSTNKSKECKICNYWYFLDKNFSYRPCLCDGCYNIMQKSIDFKNIAIVYVKRIAYRINFKYMNKHKGKILTNSNLINKMGV